MVNAQPHARIGIDLGGTKIAGIALGPGGETLAERRVRAPRTDYAATVVALADIAAAVIADLPAGWRATVGVGMPGSISPSSGVVQNANSVWLNGTPLDRDVIERLGRRVRFANDANCFALSEATDGAGAGAESVFGVIIGTGCGGGLVHHGRIVNGPRSIGGEWGHTPLAWAQSDEHPGPLCWCGRAGCMEMWASGTALQQDHARTTGHPEITGEEIAALAAAGDAQAQGSLDRHASRLARGLAMMANIFDPEIIVLGGGLSGLAHLYEVLPGLARPYIFGDTQTLDVRPPHFGDASGVRGAAWLWREGESDGAAAGAASITDTAPAA